MLCNKSDDLEFYIPLIDVNSIIIFIFILLQMMSCQQEWNPYEGKNYEVVDMSTISTKELNEYQILDYDTLHILRPVILKIFRDYLIVADLQEDEIFHLINLKKFTYEGSRLVKGYGPGEFLNVWEIISLNKDDLVIFDFIQRKLSYFHFDSLLIKNHDKPYYEIALGEYLYTSYMRDENGFYFLEHELGQHRIYHADEDFNQVKGYGTLLQKKTKYTTDLIQSEICNARAGKLGQFIFIAYQLFPFIEIFNTESKTFHSYILPENFIQEYFETGDINEIAIEGKTIFTFNQVYTTDHFAYLLYDGKIWNEENEIEGSRFIFVFDSFGHLVHKLKLAKGITYMAIYDDHYLYGIAYGETGNEIIKYNLLQ